MFGYLYEERFGYPVSEILYADVSEHSVFSIFIGRLV